MAQAFIGEVFSLVVFALLAAGIMKIFQLAGDLREVKELLRDIKRNAEISIPVPLPAPVPPPASRPSPGMTPEELVRAVHAQRFTDDEFPSLEPTVLPPQS